MRTVKGGGVVLINKREKYRDKEKKKLKQFLLFGNMKIPLNRV